mmetsp:Transcript_12510/g.37564  ORF Transcript_12510/g.37564 Transcript_12510/m.37564 type:complete len:310 (-) Transcript_12510:50-979(-)
MPRRLRTVSTSRPTVARRRLRADARGASTHLRRKSVSSYCSKRSLQRSSEDHRTRIAVQKKSQGCCHLSRSSEDHRTRMAVYTRKPRSLPFVFASLIRLVRMVFGVSLTNSSKSMSPFSSVSARAKMDCTCLSLRCLKPSAHSAAFTSSGSSTPFPSVSAASKSFCRAIRPNLDSEVSTKLEITFECSPITFARNLLSSSLPITAFAPSTTGEKMPRFASAAMETRLKGACLVANVVCLGTPKDATAGRARPKMAACKATRAEGILRAGEERRRCPPSNLPETGISRQIPFPVSWTVLPSSDPETQYCI